MILIQPNSNQAAEYCELADAEGLCFEVTEPSMPQAPDSRNVRALCALYGGRVYAAHGTFIDINVASNDPEIRRVSRARCREGCRAASDFKARHVVFHSGFFPYVQDEWYRDSWVEGSAEFYNELIAEFGVSVHVENCLDLNPSMLSSLLECAGGDKLRVCLDIGHVNYTGAPLEEWFDALGGWIGSLHFSDNRGVYDDHLPVGDGAVDWMRVSGLCRKYGLDVPVTLEVGSPDGVRRSLAFLKKNNCYPFRED